MWPAIIVVAIVILVTIATVMFAKPGSATKTEKEKPKYNYNALPHFLTPSERVFYNLLGQAVGGEYRIFAQVHLDALLDEKVPGQNYKAARAHMSQKSVDFILCDKDELRIVLAIELDDSSHMRQDRIDRDVIVEEMLKGAGVPMLRFDGMGVISPDSIGQQIRQFLASR